MGKDYPNKRDCHHGSQRGKCDLCDHEQLKSDLRKVVEDMEREAIEQRKTRHVRTAEKIEKWIAELKLLEGE